MGPAHQRKRDGGAGQASAGLKRWRGSGLWQAGPRGGAGKENNFGIFEKANNLGNF